MSRHNKRFYTIVPGMEPGTVDVYLEPTVHVYHTYLGVDEYDISVPVIRGISVYEGLEADIRLYYRHWMEIAEVIDL